jgi:ABC-type tungstate transport system substrate-binding protein
MAPLLLALFAFLALATGAAFVFGSPILGIPILIIALGVGAFAMFAKRAADTAGSANLDQEREQAQSPRTHFTERDRQTQV